MGRNDLLELGLLLGGQNGHNLLTAFFVGLLDDLLDLRLLGIGQVELIESRREMAIMGSAGWRAVRWRVGRAIISPRGLQADE